MFASFQEYDWDLYWEHWEVSLILRRLLCFCRQKDWLHLISWCRIVCGSYVVDFCDSVIPWATWPWRTATQDLRFCGIEFCVFNFKLTFGFVCTSVVFLSLNVELCEPKNKFELGNQQLWCATDWCIAELRDPVAWRSCICWCQDKSWNFPRSPSSEYSPCRCVTYCILYENETMPLGFEVAGALLCCELGWDPLVTWPVTFNEFLGAYEIQTLFEAFEPYSFAGWPRMWWCRNTCVTTQPFQYGSSWLSDASSCEDFMSFLYEFPP